MTRPGLVGPGRPASRARCGAPHLFLWPVLLRSLFARPPPGWGCPFFLLCASVVHGLPCFRARAALGLGVLLLPPFPFFLSRFPFFFRFVHPRCLWRSVISGLGFLGPWRLLVPPSPPFFFFILFFCAFFLFFACFSLGLCFFSSPPPFSVFFSSFYRHRCSRRSVCSGPRCLGPWCLVVPPPRPPPFLFLPSWFFFVRALPLVRCGAGLCVVGCGVCWCVLRWCCRCRCSLCGAPPPLRRWLVLCGVVCCNWVFAVGPGCPVLPPGGSWCGVPLVLSLSGRVARSPVVWCGVSWCSAALCCVLWRCAAVWWCAVRLCCLLASLPVPVVCFLPLRVCFVCSRMSCCAFCVLCALCRAVLRCVGALALCCPRGLHCFWCLVLLVPGVAACFWGSAGGSGCLALSFDGVCWPWCPCLAAFPVAWRLPCGVLLPCVVSCGAVLVVWSCAVVPCRLFFFALLVALVVCFL